MRPNQDSPLHSPNPATVTTHLSVTSNPSKPHSAYDALTNPRKRAIAELINDQDALADWHRNLARLRA